METSCPHCGEPMDAKWVNVERNLAKCEHCNAIFPADELLQGLVSSSGREYDTPLPAVKEDAPLDLRPPVGSKVSIEAFDQNSLRIRNSRGGFGIQSLFMGVFATFWLGFVAFWTFMAAQGSIFFALFSIPFWFVGFGLAGGLIKSILGRDKIEFLDEGVRLTKWGIFRNKEILIPYDDIDHISLSNWKNSEKVSKRPFASIAFTATTEVAPGISYGVNREYFFTNLTRTDMEWITRVMNQVLESKRDERRYFG